MTDSNGLDTTTKYAGLELAHPIVASSSPLTGDIDSLLELEEAGAAAVILPSLFEEQVEAEALALEAALDFGSEYHAEVAGGFLPEVALYDNTSDQALGLIRQAKAQLSIPVIASLNGISTGGWTHFAQSMEAAGADALELNVYKVAADPSMSCDQVEANYLHLVQELRAQISIPLTVKIGPYFSSVSHFANRLADSGADGLVLFNRFYQPDIDLDSMTVVPDLVLSSQDELRLILRWMAILHGRVDASLGATTGVHDADDAVKLILSGADVVMMTSALILHGAGHLSGVLVGMKQWFAKREYESIDQARGSMSQEGVANPTAFERANYLQAIQSLH